MAAQRSHTLTISILLMLFFSTLSSASDMSIISYDETHIHRRTDDEVAALYESWLIEHGKSYNALGEKDKRFQIFKDNLKYIDEQNSVPDKSYKLGLTKFADLTNEEYRSIYLGYKSSGDRRRLSTKESDRYLPKVGDNLPESIDWREKGVLVGIKDQGGCGKLIEYFGYRSKIN